MDLKAVTSCLIRFGSPTVTKDGVTVAKEIELEDPYQNMGAQMVREVASKTSDSAGDGTTTATVLAEAVFRQGLKHVTAGMNPIGIQRGIEKAVDAAVVSSVRLPRRSKTRAKCKQVATVSANWDATIGEIIADAMDKVGKDGTITVEEAKSIETTLDVVEGMQFDKGYLSPYFSTNTETMEAKLEDAYVLIFEKKIRTLSRSSSFAGKRREDGQASVDHRGRRRRRSARDARGEQDPWHPEHLRCEGTGFGDRRKAMLEDIAILTGGRCIN